MTFTGTGMSMSFDDCSSIHSDRWVNDNEGGGAIRGETLTFTDMGDLSFNNCKSIVNADTNAGGAVNARGDITFSHMGNISFTNNMLGDDSQQGKPSEGPCSRGERSTLKIPSPSCSAETPPDTRPRAPTPTSGAPFMQARMIPLLRQPRLTFPPGNMR